MVKQETNERRVVDLQAPEILEFKTAPMFMCCGSFSYSISINPISIFNVTVTWVEDPGAACSGI